MDRSRPPRSGEFAAPSEAAVIGCEWHTLRGSANAAELAALLTLYSRLTRRGQRHISAEQVLAWDHGRPRSGLPAPLPGAGERRWDRAAVMMWFLGRRAGARRRPA